MDAARRWPNWDHAPNYLGDPPDDHFSRAVDAGVDMRFVIPEQFELIMGRPPLPSELVRRRIYVRGHLTDVLGAHIVNAAADEISSDEMEENETDDNPDLANDNEPSAIDRAIDAEYMRTCATPLLFYYEVQRRDRFLSLDNAIEEWGQMPRQVKDEYTRAWQMFRDIDEDEDADMALDDLLAQDELERRAGPGADGIVLPTIDEDEAPDDAVPNNTPQTSPRDEKRSSDVDRDESAADRADRRPPALAAEESAASPHFGRTQWMRKTGGEATFAQEVPPTTLGEG